MLHGYYYSLAIPSNTTTYIQIDTGKVIFVYSFIKDYSISSSGAGWMFVEKDARTVRIMANTSGDANVMNSASPVLFPIAGPAKIKITTTSSDAFCSYRISDNEDISVQKPSTSVVIPSDSMGPVDIILESSTDLLSWTEALPGTYGSTDNKRFFRVRAVTRN